MAFDREESLRARQRRRETNVPWTSSGASFVIPVALLIAAVLIGWVMYGSLSPTVDNTGTTTPVTPTDLPQTTPKASP